MKNNLIRLLAVVLFSATFSVQADITLEIVTQGAHQIPVVILPFANESPGDKALSSIVRADLTRSGLFSVLDASDVKPAPSDVEEVHWEDWRNRHADYLVVGNVLELPGHRMEARFRLVDVNTQVARLNMAFQGAHEQYRTVAHRIADAIFENLTGDKGMFNTRIAYITKLGNARSLKVADSDGFGEQTMLSANEPIISPRWSPDGKRMAYVTFELKRPMVVVQTLATAARKIVASFKGSNSAPAWSPDGSQLAVVLTKDGHSQIYLINADGTGPVRRLLTSGGIDTEPVFSADGQTLYFTSDRDGGPQIYRVSLNGSDPPQRLTYGSTYAVSPRLSPDGKQLTYVQRNEGQFHVMLQDLATGQSQVMTDTSLDESPTFAPNGKYILYSTEVQGRGILAIVSTDGRVRQNLTTQTGDVYEPVWGPAQ
ncbi:MAG: Tol-Pal system protein TolB [Betaproteobacteria bacterium]|nr:Tol-Pal system protein TolB [Betaproteobacteria bacterium]